MRTVGLMVLMMGLAGCVSLPPGVFPPVAAADLLAGRGVIAASEEPLPSADILQVSSGMHSFIDRQRRQEGFSRRPLEGLLIGMRREGLLQLEYDSLETLTAAETYYQRRGNCLSYTNLIIALAREIGLEARYQLVAAPEILEREKDAVLVYRHINALVQVHRGRRFEVDFNAERNRDEYERVLVSDDYARALYYSNLSALAILR